MLTVWYFYHIIDTLCHGVYTLLSGCDRAQESGVYTMRTLTGGATVSKWWYVHAVYTYSTMRRDIMIAWYATESAAKAQVTRLQRRADRNDTGVTYYVSEGAEIS